MRQRRLKLLLLHLLQRVEKYPVQISSCSDLYEDLSYFDGAGNVVFGRMELSARMLDGILGLIVYYLFRSRFFGQKSQCLCRVVACISI